MSLPSELVAEVKKLTTEVLNILDVTKLLKEEVTDAIADNHNEALKKIADLEAHIQKVEAYQKTIIEPNQHTLLEAIKKTGSKE